MADTRVYNVRRGILDWISDDRAVKRIGDAEAVTAREGS